MTTLEKTALLVSGLAFEQIGWGASIGNPFTQPAFVVPRCLDFVDTPVSPHDNLIGRQRPPQHISED